MINNVGCGLCKPDAETYTYIGEGACAVLRMVSQTTSGSIINWAEEDVAICIFSLLLVSHTDSTLLPVLYLQLKYNVFQTKWTVFNTKSLV